MKLLKRK